MPLFKELKNCLFLLLTILITVERGSLRTYFLPRVNTANYNVLIDGRNLYDQPINEQVKKYNKIRKIATGQGDDYTTGCCYQLIAVDQLDADPRAIQ